MAGLDTRGIDVAGLEHAPAPEVQHGFRVFLSEAAFDRAVERGDADADREIGGVLVGVVRKDDAGPYILVESTIDALHAEEKGTELTFTHATWDHIHKEMDAHHEGRRVLGWYHTHPGFGIFLSDRDQFIHRSFFDLPFQIAFVYDPKSREHGVFTWRDNEPVRSRRYWVGAREHVRDPEPAAPAASKAPAAPSTAPSPPAADPALDRMGLASAGLLLVLIGGMAGWWIGAGRVERAVQELEVRHAQERAAHAEQLLATVNPELLLLLRRLLDGDGVRGPLGQCAEEVDRALKRLEESPGDADALVALRDARRKLRELVTGYDTATRTLRALEDAARRPQVDVRAAVRHLPRHAAAIGQLCVDAAEAAAAAGDLARARRLLHLAAQIDAGRAETYLRKADELKEPR